MDGNKLILPGAIVIAALLIGGAIIFNKDGGSGGDTNNGDPVPTDTITLTSEDHIFGNPDAKIKLVEYSDPQCKFCKAFHPTMKRIMSEYGEDGQVAWVYRHFVLFGEESERQSVATECAMELGGPEKFWVYLDTLFASKDENAKLLPGKTLEGVAQEVGLNLEQFNSCLESGKYDEKIESWKNQAIAAGGKGTPYTLVIDKDGKILGPVNGAQPYENVKSILDQVLSETE